MGEGWLVAQIGGFFFVLLVLLSLIAIEIDGEKRWLTVYAPFSVIGYKQFLDLVLFKAVYDVLMNRELGWTFAGRPERLDSDALEYDPSTAYADLNEPALEEKQRPPGSKRRASGDDGRRLRDDEAL